MLVHQGESQRRAGVAAWAGNALQLGARILYIEPHDVPVERSLLHVLDEHSVAVADAVASGQLTVLAADAEVYSPTWRAQMVDEALAEGYPTVRWSGETRTAYATISRTAHAELERASDELCRTKPVSMLCQYPSGVGDADLQEACAVHAHGVRESATRTRPMADGIALGGSVDVANEKVVRSALAVATSTPHDGRGSFVVDLGALDFIDVAGVRALLVGTSAHRANGGQVRLRAPQPQVERLLRMLAVHEADGMRIEDE